MSTQPTATAQLAPAAHACAAGSVPPEDRLPTFAEIDGFDANAAYDRLSPAEQRRVGILAVRLGVVGQRLSFPHDDWSCAQRRLIENRESDELGTFMDAIEPLWARLFDWATPRWSKPVIRQVA